jgi:hypothetical protein
MAPVPENIMLIIGFQAIITIIALILLGLISKKYINRKTEILKVLFLLFLFMVLAMVTNLFGMWAHYVIYVEDGYTFEPVGGLGAHIMKLFIAYRITYIFTVLAIYCSYLLEQKIFERKPDTRKQRENQVFLLIVILFTIFAYKWHGFIMDLIDFGLVFLYMVLVLIPFAKKSFKLAAKLQDEPIYQKAMKMLGYMATCMMGQFFFFLLERIVVTLTHIGFSPFFYIAWLAGLFSLVCAYFGYLQPKPNEKDAE